VAVVLATLLASIAWAGTAGANQAGTPPVGHLTEGAGSSGGAASSSSRASPSWSSSSASRAQSFDRYVEATTSALARAGVPAREIRPPYTGRPAEVVDGVVVPGYALSSNVTPYYNTTPAPAGIAYFGENDTSGKIEATTVSASSVEGTLSVNQLTALYLDDDAPDMWGIQLNTMLTNVTIQGVPGNSFWVQNAVDYFDHDDSLALGEATWNFSSSTVYGIPVNGTIESHNPNGSNVEGIYIGEGPTLFAPMPFTLTLFVNSSLTRAHDQELWYNYSLSAAGGIHKVGNFDWLIFNSTNAAHPATVPLASFTASGTHISPGGLIEDYEFDFGIGPEDGAVMDVLAANATATLDYCPATIPSCSPAQFRSVPAALDFGTETGETSVGLSIAYNGTTAIASAGPLILRGLWGYPSAPGATAGATPVANEIRVTGSPVSSSEPPYVFVFFNGTTFVNPRFEWAPDVPVWHLAPGNYRYEVMLADYAEVTGTLSVGTTPTALAVTLTYQPSSGVYTPLWAFGNSQLPGISSSGNGTVADQYRLFNNPTSGCTECGNATDGNLSPVFFPIDGFLFPVFAGLLLYHTSAYVDIDHPPSFCVYGFTYGPPSHPVAGPNFYLQIELVWTHNVTLANDTEAGGWPGMPELATLAGIVNASVNPFPQANVMVWNSTDDLLMSNTFVPSWLLPNPPTDCTTGCPAISCYSYACVSPDGLLLYGGTNNTVWGNTFEDPHVPPNEPPQTYAGLAEAESGDLIFNNNFSVDNPTVLMPFDIYNNSCPDGYAGDCAPPLPPTYVDAWNVTVQPATRVAATVNGFGLSGNILGSGCKDQGGNYWSDYGNALNPIGVLPFANSYDYSSLLPALPSWWTANETSIQIGGDYAPLVPSATCVSGVTIPSPSPYPTLSSADVTAIGLGAVVGIAVLAVVVLYPRLRSTPAPWLNAPLTGGQGPSADRVLPLPLQPSWRERWKRRPFGFGMWAGVVVLGAYVGAAVSALIVFRNSVDQVPIDPNWIPPFSPIGPSWSHPFGVLPGLGTGLFRAVWQATPWDLAIVAAILALDAVLGWVLGALAGACEGSALDSVVVTLGDTFGAIPSFFLVVTLFAGLATAFPGSTGLPLFVVLFGMVLWPTIARTTRERARSIAREPYLESARASGAGRPYLFFRHVLPGSVSPLLAQLPIDVAPIFFVLTVFPWFWDCAGPGGAKVSGPFGDFFVASLPPYSPLPAVNFPEWGNLLAIGACSGLPISTVGGPYWWMFFFPLIAILGLGVAIALVCDGIDRRLSSRRG